MNPSAFSVAVLILTPQGIPLVRDPKKPAPVYWKLPGGRSEGEETAEECAIREVKEELGFTLKLKDLTQIFEEGRGSHMLVIFKASVKDLSDLKEFGNEGEDIQIFSPRTVLTMKDFFPNHRRIVETELSTFV